MCRGDTAVRYTVIIMLSEVPSCHCYLGKYQTRPAGCLLTLLCRHTHCTHMNGNLALLAYTSSDIMAN